MDQLFDLMLFAPLAGRKDLVALEATVLHTEGTAKKQALQAYARQALQNVAGMRGADIVRLRSAAKAF